MHCRSVIQRIHRHLVVVQQGFVRDNIPNVVRQRIEARRYTFQYGIFLHTGQVTFISRIHLHLNNVTNVSSQNEVGTSFSCDLRKLVEQLVLSFTVSHGVGVVLTVTNFVLGIHFIYSRNNEL
ncbi:hypothetical protein D9M71_684510 [compost metagenome]